MIDTKVNILLVEDDPDDYILIKDLLSRASPQAFDLEWVDEYDAALDAIKSRRHDVCLLDYRLGERDGLDLLREALDIGCKIPIILLTGQGDYGIDVEAMNAGASDFLEKGELDAKLFERSIRYAVTRKRLEEQIRETSRLASIGELAAGVAHEINNPLTSVIGFSHLLLAQELPSHVTTDLKRIHGEAKRAAKIVKNLLFFARRADTEKSPVSISLLLERALELKAPDFRTKSVTVDINIEPDLPSTMADEQQILQLFLNILTNAEQACLEAHGRGHLLIRLSSLQDRLLISIRDNGPGIPPEIMSKIFEPFFTTKEVGEGTGLGLSICHGIIHQHNGELWVESPMISIAPGITAPPTDQEHQIATTGHLLVVDDEPLIRDLLSKYLQMQQFEVDLAEEGGEAWQRIQASSYDCILLDLKMPGISGEQLYQQLVASDKGVADKVIFMTGDTLNSDTRDFIESTGNPVMTKPFDFENLQQALLDMVGSPA